MKKVLFLLLFTTLLLIACQNNTDTSLITYQRLEVSLTKAGSITIVNQEGKTHLVETTIQTSDEGESEKIQFNVTVDGIQQCYVYYTVDNTRLSGSSNPNSDTPFYCDEGKQTLLVDEKWEVTGTTDLNYQQTTLIPFDYYRLEAGSWLLTDMKGTTHTLTITTEKGVLEKVYTATVNQETICTAAEKGILSRPQNDSILFTLNVATPKMSANAPRTKVNGSILFSVCTVFFHFQSKKNKLMTRNTAKESSYIWMGLWKRVNNLISD